MSVARVPSVRDLAPGRLELRAIVITVRQKMKCDGFEQAQAANTVSVLLRCQLQRDDAAIRMSDQVELLAGLQLMGEHRFHQANFVAKAVAIARHGGFAIAEQIDGYQSIAVAQAFDQLPPLALRAHRTVQQHDGRALALDTQTDPTRRQ